MLSVYSFMNNIRILGSLLKNNCNLVNDTYLYKISDFAIQACDGFTNSSKGQEINDIEAKKILEHIDKAFLEKRIIECIGNENKVSIYYKHYVNDNKGPYDTIMTTFEKV